MDDVRGDFIGPPHGTTPAAVIANKNFYFNTISDCSQSTSFSATVQMHMPWCPFITSVRIKLHNRDEQPKLTLDTQWLLKYDKKVNVSMIRKWPIRLIPTKKTSCEKKN